MSNQHINQPTGTAQSNVSSIDTQDEMILVELEERLEFTQATDGRCNGNGSNNHVVAA